MFRSRKLLDLARGQNCMVRIPGVCNGNHETVVAAHANWNEYGKGGALKAHDCYTSWACSACHEAIDQGNKLSYEEKKDYWRRGFERTVFEMFNQGLLKVK